jgi:hypothetical protein
VTNTPAYKAASVESFFGVNAVNHFCYLLMVKTNKVSKNLSLAQLRARQEAIRYPTGYTHTGLLEILDKLSLIFVSWPLA